MTAILRLRYFSKAFIEWQAMDYAPLNRAYDLSCRQWEEVVCLVHGPASATHTVGH